MISKSIIAAMVLITMGLASGLASPAFAQVFVQVPASYYYGYAYPYGPPLAYGWGPYGFGYWSPNNPHSIDNNIHTPPNH